MTTVLVTGVTGTIMSEVVRLLQERGSKVVALVRAKNGIGPAQRLAETLGIKPVDSANLFPLAGDIHQELSGVASEDLHFWKGKIDCVVHGAASVKLGGTAEELFRTNVEGTKHVLELARELGVSAFHYVSTIYVAGNSKSFQETHLHEGQILRNEYERSKVEAEELVRRFCREFDLRFSIFRLPVVIGDSRTGKIGNLSAGYYGFFGSFPRIRQYLLRKEKEQPGILKFEEGLIALPITIACTREGPLQIVPIDWVANVLAVLIGIPAKDETFHLSHPKPPKTREVIEFSMRHLGFKWKPCGIENRHPVFGKIEKMVLVRTKPFQPYTMYDMQELGNERLVSALAAHGTPFTPPPDVTAELLGRLLTYAKERNFGRL